MAKNLAVVIPFAGSLELLNRTLDSLAAAEQPSNFRQTIVIENGKRRGGEKVVERYRQSLRALHLYEPVPGKSHALNRAVSQLPDHLVVFLDDDVRVAPELLSSYARAAEGVEQGEFYGGPFGVDYEVSPPKWLQAYLPGSAVGWSLADDATTIEKPSFLGFNWAVFANDLKAVGGFDENLGPGALTRCYVGDEITLQQTLLARGVRGKYVKDAMVWHYVPQDRCTPRWTLQRKYRHAMSSGIRYEDDSPTFCGFPRWTFKIALQKYLDVLASTFTATPEQRFSKKCDYWTFRGYMAGCRIAIQQRQTRR